MRSTHFLETIEGQVGSRKETDRARGTHFLETTEGETSQGTGKKPTKLGALTNWRPHRERQVSTQDMERMRPSEGHSLPRDRKGFKTLEECDRERGTHSLKTAEGRPDQDTQGKRPREGHSLPEDYRGRDKSEPWKETDRARATHQLEPQR